MSTAVSGIADAISRVLSSLRRASHFQAAVRLALLAITLLLGQALTVASPGPGTRTIAVVATLVLLVVAARPAGSASLGAWILLALWVWLSAPGWTLLIGITLAVWAVQRLQCWASTGPGHGVLGRAAFSMLGRDAAVEFGWLLALGALVAAGAVWGGALPGGRWWAASFLVAAFVFCLTVVTARRPR